MVKRKVTVALVKPTLVIVDTNAEKRFNYAVLSNKVLPLDNAYYGIICINKGGNSFTTEGYIFYSLAFSCPRCECSDLIVICPRCGYQMFLSGSLMFPEKKKAGKGGEI